MTDTALAATLYGAEDLRMVERQLGTLEPGIPEPRVSHESQDGMGHFKEPSARDGK